VTFVSVDTGQGANELYDMDQHVMKSSDVVFAHFSCTDIDTGQGITEVYAMNQDVETSANVTFSTVTTGTLSTGQGQNELYGMDQGVETTDAVEFAAVTAVDGEFTTVKVATLEATNATFNSVTCSNLNSTGSRMVLTGDEVEGFRFDGDEALTTSYLDVVPYYPLAGYISPYPTDTWSLGRGSYVFERSYVIQMYIKAAASGPSEPAVGQGLIWLSDGTGHGDQGDVVVGSNVGGVTKWAVIFDYSAGAAW